MKRLGSRVLAVVLVLGAICMPVAANSAPVGIAPGNNGIGVAVVDLGNPLIVEHETLTFDIAAFPERGSSIASNAKVTAQYTLYNPTDKAVTTTLLFPFGTQPDYADYYQEAYPTEMYEDMKVSAVDDTLQYDVLVDGKPIEKKLRHTYYYPYSNEEFILGENLRRLKNGFAENDFFNPELPVIKYTCRARDLQSKALAVIENAQAVVYLKDGARTGGKGIGTWVEHNGDRAEIYVFGTALAEDLQWKLYKSDSWDNMEEVPGVLEVESTETMTFRDFALLTRPADSPVSEMDWYNAVMHEISEQDLKEQEGVLCFDGYQFHYAQRLMRWYEYEITVEAGSRIINTVTAPIYPGIDRAYDPLVYRYRYLLSPAQSWKSFGTLEIVVNTPYYVTECNQGTLTKTENGYTMTLEGLPKGELDLSLSTTNDPKKARSYWEELLSGFTGVMIALAAIMAIVLVIRCFRKE